MINLDSQMNRLREFDFSDIECQIILEELVDRLSSTYFRDIPEEGSYSKDMHRYNDLQKALLMKNMEQIENILEQEPVLELSNTLPTEYLAYLCWNQMTPEMQIAFFAKYFKNNSLFIDLFEISSSQVQEYLLERCFVAGNIEIFCSLFHLFSQKMMQQDEYLGCTWFIRAICAGNKELVTFFLEQNVSVTYIDSKCFTILDYAMNNRDSLGEDLIREIESRDAGFSEEMFSMKMFCLLFPSLSDRFRGLFGFQIPTLQSTIIDAMQDMENISDMNPISNPAMRRAVENALSDPLVLAEKAIEEWSIVLCGWNSHAISFIFTKDVCVYINTELGSKSGLHIFKMPEDLPQDQIEDAIQQLQDILRLLVTDEIGQAYCEEQMPDRLDLEKIGFIPYRQTGVNCTLFALQGALLGLSIISLLEKRDVEISSHTLFQTAPFGQVAVDHFFDELSVHVLQKGLHILDKYPQFFSKREVCRKILESCIETERFESIYMLLQEYPYLKEYQHPVSRDSLLQIVLSKKNRCVFDYHFIKLLEMGIDQDHRNIEGKNLVESLQEDPLCLSDYEQWLMLYEDSPSGLYELMDVLEKNNFIPLLLNYRCPVTEQSLAALALQEKKYRLFAFLLSIGYQGPPFDRSMIRDYSDEELGKLCRHLEHYQVSLDDPRIAISD